LEEHDESAEQENQNIKHEEVVVDLATDV